MAHSPENTLVSFGEAFEDGATIVEFDVRQTRDGSVVIIHDATLGRTTEKDGEVNTHNLADLRDLDAGYRFTLDEGVTFPYRGRHVQIPTLEDFFLTFPQGKAIIEIKTFTPSIVQRTLEVIRRFHSEERVLLATEQDLVMAEIRDELKRLDLAIATGFSYAEVAAFIHWVQTGKANPFAPPGQAFQIPCEYEGVTLVSPDTVSASHALGVEMFVWTVNDPSEMERLLGLGVDGIITDYPARLRSLVRQAV